MITKHKLKIGIGVVVGATALTLLLGGGGDFNSKMSSQVKGKYSIAGEKLTMIAKSDPKDRVVVEVGDTVFKPKVKISRWDEVDLSLTLKDNEVGAETISSKDDKIVWSKGNIETNFYDLPITASNSEGGYEFEVILKEKPKTNVIEFTLETKGLDFFYQPELTQQEIDEGASRPENVVGSYAVYAKTPKTNWTGGKEYKANKVGHIYRPQIIDSAGTKVWGTLKIEKITETLSNLSVEMPPEFWDKAVYPVRHAAGLTFGYNTEGTAGSSAYSGYSYGSLFTGVAGTGVSISAYVYNETNVNTQYAIYLHSDLTLVTNGITSLGTTGTETTGWKTLNFSSAPTFSAVDYILLAYANFDWETHNLYYDAGDSNQGHYSGEAYIEHWESPISPAPTHNNNKYSIYATYESAAPPVGAPIIDDFIIIQPE